MASADSTSEKAITRGESRGTSTGALNNTTPSTSIGILYIREALRVVAWRYVVCLGPDPSIYFNKDAANDWVGWSVSASHHGILGRSREERRDRERKPTFRLFPGRDAGLSYFRQGIQLSRRPRTETRQGTNKQTTHGRKGSTGGSLA